VTQTIGLALAPGRLPLLKLDELDQFLSGERRGLVEADRLGNAAAKMEGQLTKPRFADLDRAAAAG
jgi:hypothetical protein